MPESPTLIDELGPLANMPVEVEGELDRRTMTLEEVARLEIGSVVRMSRSAGENIDIYVGSELIGYGEVVVVENSLCIRVTDFRDKVI